MLDSLGNGLEYLGSLVYQRQNGVLTLESAAVEGGRIRAGQTSSGTTYAPQYYLADHLGSTRAVTDGTAANTIRYNYYPFGKQWTTADSQISDNRDLFNGKEWQPTGGVNLLDYGARMYDSELGIWGVPDRMSAKRAAISPYIFCSNNPITRIDADGNWDVTVHVHGNRQTNGYGVAIVTDRHGSEVFRFQVRAEGAGGRNRMAENADTPLGEYDIPNNGAWMSGDTRASYGPNHRLIMVGQSGEIAESGRDKIRIHGGRQEDFKDGKWIQRKNPTLGRTNGCLRAFEADMILFKQLTDALEAADSEENPGEVTVLDDLDDFTTQEKKKEEEKEKEDKKTDDEQFKMPSYREQFLNLVQSMLDRYK